MGHSYLMYYMTGFIMIPVFLFALACQFSVKSNFNKYSKIANSRGMTGADAAFRLLQLNGIIMTLKIRKFAFRRMFFHQEVLPQSALLVTRQVMHVSMRRDMRRLKFAMQ